VAPLGLTTVSSDPVIGVLALQGDVREHLSALAATGALARPVRRPAELEGLHGIVLPGGESTTMYKLARTFELFEPLRAAIRDGLPAFGTCAGMIMLADHIEGGIAGQETIGGLDVVVRRNAFGRQVDSFEEVVTFEPSWSDAFDFPATFIRAPLNRFVAVMPARSAKLLSVGPGHRQLTLTPRPVTSSAIPSVNDSTYALVA